MACCASPASAFCSLIGCKSTLQTTWHLTVSVRGGRVLQWLLIDAVGFYVAVTYSVNSKPFIKDIPRFLTPDLG